MSILSHAVEGSVLSLTVQVPRLDAVTARDFKLECDKIWTQSFTAVHLDLSQVEFIDSSGVGALLNLYKRQPATAPGVKLLKVRPAVQAVIELLRLHRIFEISS